MTSIASYAAWSALYLLLAGLAAAAVIAVVCSPWWIADRIVCRRLRRHESAARIRRRDLSARQLARLHADVAGLLERAAAEDRDDPADVD